MALRVAIQMDPVELANPATDTTLMMALSAQARGHRLWVYRPDRLAMEDGRVRARARPLTVRNVAGDHFTLGEPSTLDLADDVDVVLMRQDPPFDLAYITATYLLEHVATRTLVVNDPAAVRDAPEKLFVTRFPGLQPPTLVSHDPVAIADFRARYPDMILKPLYGGGGSGVARLKPGDANLEAMLELHFALNREPVICQAFLPAVEQGDKRILLVEGEPVGVVNRVPAKGQDRSNLRVGGRAEAVELSSRDREICAAVGPELKARGLVFAGLDVIGDWLTEINVTSPTGARQLQGFTGVDATDLMWGAIEGRVATRRS